MPTSIPVPADLSRPAYEANVDPSLIRAEQIAIAFDTAVCGTMTSDLSSGESRVSTGVWRLLGHPPDEPHPAMLRLLSLIHPDDLDAFLAARSHSVASGIALEKTVRLRRLDGTWVWVQITARPLADATGEPVMLTGILRDVSLTREFEGRLRASEQRYRTLFTEAPLPMLVFDPDGGRIIEANAAAVALYGYENGVLEGEPIERLLDRSHVDRFHSLFGQSRETGVRAAQMRHVRRDGSLLEVECRFFSMQTGQHNAHVVLINDITERLAARAEILRLAAIDPLTQLYNRVALAHRLEQALERAKSKGRFGALLHVNLDSFKSVNDALGYDGANHLLIEIAERLKHVAGVASIVARVAGDEFVVLREALHSQEDPAALRAESFAKSLLDAIREPVRIDDAHYLVTASIGVALFDGHTPSAESVLRNADAAVERSRMMGRNQVRFCDPSMQQAVARRAALEMDLRRALRADQFELYFQVQVDQAMRPKGAEVLLRWNHPVRGMIPPLEFIGLAEETGTILTIGRWVLQQACLKLAQWATMEQFARLRLSVNVSARQFRQADFVAQVREALAISGADPSRLSLELTESLLLDYAEEAVLKMQEIRALGVGFSLDDFGTGYSSLSYLKRLPLDELKVDRTFTRDILTDPSDAMIVRTIIGMARNLGLELIAEGVESVQQHGLLARWGCTGFQGFYYGKPLPETAFMLAVESAVEHSRGGAMIATAIENNSAVVDLISKPRLVGGKESSG